MRIEYCQGARTQTEILSLTQINGLAFLIGHLMWGAALGLLTRWALRTA
jgi:hypothetical protein